MHEEHYAYRLRTQVSKGVSRSHTFRREAYLPKYSIWIHYQVQYLAQLADRIGILEARRKLYYGISQRRRNIGCDDLVASTPVNNGTGVCDMDE